MKTIPHAPKKAGRVEEKGVAYLLSQQNPDGSFGKPEGRHVARGRKALDEFIFSGQYGRRFSDND